MNYRFIRDVRTIVNLEATYRKHVIVLLSEQFGLVFFLLHIAVVVFQRLGGPFDVFEMLVQLILRKFHLLKWEKNCFRKIGLSTLLRLSLTIETLLCVVTTTET